MRKKTACMAAAVLSLLILYSMIWPLGGRLLMPQRTDFGANWGAFLQEKKNSVDAMFFGSSLVYCDIRPECFAEESGISAYVLAGPEQNMALTYYYIREALKTQSPSVIFVEMTEMYFPENNSFQKTNIGYMPWSENRLNAVFRTARKEEWAGLLFPICNYHNRWMEITPQELLQNWKGYEADPCRGYTYLEESAAQEGFFEKEVDDKEYEYNRKWFQKTARLARDRSITLVAYLTPCIQRLSEKRTDRIRRDTAAEGVLFIDCNPSFEEFGFDLQRDFYDSLHTNYRGAEKFSRWMGRKAQELLP